MVCITYESITGWAVVIAIAAIMWGLYWIGKDFPSADLPRSEHDRDKYSAGRERWIGNGRLGKAKPKAEARYYEGILGGDGGQTLQPSTENNQREP